MRYGMPYSTCYGSPSKVIAYVRRRPVGGSVEVTFKARTNEGDTWFGIYVNAKKALHVYAEEGKEKVVRVPLPWNSTEATVHVMPLGLCSDLSTNFSHVARGIEAADSPRTTLQLAFTGEVINPDAEEDDGHTSSWSLSGLKYGKNVERVTGLITRGRLECVLTVTGGNVTCTLNRLGRPVATGTEAVASLPAAVSLTASDSSGLTGSVTIAATVATHTFDLYARWPQSVKVLRDTSDPPSTEVATITFTGKQAVNWTEPSDLAADTYYYRLKPVSDTGQDGTVSDTMTSVIVGPPDPPTNLAYSSGNAAATILSFTDTPTAGATYRAYLQDINDETIDFEAVNATAVEDAGQITLGAITNYPGTARAVVRAVNGGVEESNLATIELEYDSSGDYVAARPNIASLDILTLAVTSGLTVGIRGVYDSNNEPGTATQIKLFVRSPSGSYNFASPSDTETLVAAGAGVKIATFSAVMGAAGWYYMKAVAYTAAGLSSVTADCPEIQVYVSDGAVSAVTNAQAHVSRG